MTAALQEASQLHKVREEGTASTDAGSDEVETDEDGAETSKPGEEDNAEEGEAQKEAQEETQDALEEQQHEQEEQQRQELGGQDRPLEIPEELVVAGMREAQDRIEDLEDPASRPADFRLNSGKSSDSIAMIHTTIWPGTAGSLAPT